MRRGPYIIIAGSIGVGKTTVANLVARRYEKALLLPEIRDIYLERYYQDPKGFAFLNQLAYSLQYLEQAVEIQSWRDVVVQDRSIYDTHCVFSRARLDEGLICTENFALLERLYGAVSKIASPDLLVLLQAPVEMAHARMRRRGVASEMAVPIDYLRRLDEAYKRWYATFDLCPKVAIDTSELPPWSVSELIVNSLKQYSQLLRPWPSTSTSH